jgi:hypothetical protein
VLSALAGQGPLSTPEPAAAGQKSVESTLSAAVSGADPRAVLDEVRRFFAGNRLLSREEFLLIAKRVPRS